MKRIRFSDLSHADLVVDAIYEGDNTTSSYSGEPLHHLIPGIGTQGGFRKRKGAHDGFVGLILTSTGSEPDWPDELNPFTGTYVYYGDNRIPGRSLHETKQGGNKTLAQIFELAYGGLEGRLQCPVILIFESVSTGRDMVFRGLAVPGSPLHGPKEDLVAVWKTDKGQRFQNYRAIFTILDCGVISGDWVRKVFENRALEIDDPRIPAALLVWIKTGKLTPLQAEPIRTRQVDEQRPTSGLQERLIEAIYERCSSDPFLFEPIAAEIWRIACTSPLEMEMTRRYRDGGRDAIGNLILGPKSDAIKLSFALEAKLYNPQNRVGVKETSRLISRLKHREFGVLVTTSVLDKQAYEEIRQDGHPIVVISGRDIAETLISADINSEEKLLAWMSMLIGEGR